jgi:hypothetical protein
MLLAVCFSPLGSEDIEKKLKAKEEKDKKDKESPASRKKVRHNAP